MHMIRYSIHPQHVERNEQLVRAIFDELRAVEPPGLRYAAFTADDGVSFVHLISHELDGGHLPGRQLGSLRTFHAGLSGRCVAPPIRTELSEIGGFPPRS